MTIEPLAIMFSKQDHELKKIIDDEMRRLIVMGEAQQIYDKWFMQAIPPTNRSLNLSMSFLLKDFWKYPTELGSN